MTENCQKQLQITSEEEQWRLKTHKKRIVLLVLAILYVPLGGTIHILTKSDVITLPIVIVHFVTMAILGISISASKCPRCKNNFFYTWAFKNPFSNKCLHCGFKIIE